MGAAVKEKTDLMPELIKGTRADKALDELTINLTGTKSTQCENLIKQLEKLHIKFGKKHLVREKTISDRTYTNRWHGIHQIAIGLYMLGFHLEKVEKIKRKHCIALCKAWEAAGYSASAIANKKTELRTILFMSGRKSVIDDIKLEHLFEDPKCIYRPTKTKVDKSMSAGMSNVNLEMMFDIKVKDIGTLWDCQPQKMIEFIKSNVKERPVSAILQSQRDKKLALKRRDEKFVMMLEMMYLFGLRTSEAISFRPNKDVTYDSNGGIKSIKVIRQGAKGGRERIVDIYQDRQVTLLKELCSNKYLKNGALVGYQKKFASFKTMFYRFTKTYGLTKENNMHPYSLRHEYAQSLLEFFTGEPSPIRSRGVVNNPQVLKKAKKIVSKQLGHNRLYITDAYTG